MERGEEKSAVIDWWLCFICERWSLIILKDVNFSVVLTFFLQPFQGIGMFVLKMASGYEVMIGYCV